MFRYEKTSLIKNCTLEELYEFHLDSNNLVKITPPDMNVTMLNDSFEAKEDEILRLKTEKKFMPIPIYWEVKILKNQKPNLLVDFAMKSPFRYWKHSHIFTKRGNSVELKDEVLYVLPFGKIGKLFNFFVERELEKMFNYRHKVTKEILSQQNNIN
ncbi:SRPBCC family protein [Arcobacter arenosus]|uniref:SRPBCC family protein n=1 Tax=Arcobacter arenosus TaxID=2576037 RepID=UPI003BA85A5C